MSRSFFSLISLRNWCIRSTFLNSGLRPTTTDLGDGTVIHCWVPKTRQESKPNLLLIHGIGANAMWQWAEVVGRLTPHFNVYVPDLVFFGSSYTTRPERTESFQAECLVRLVEALCVKGRLRVVGLSYGGFVAYSMAVQFKDVVERLVICCAAVCMEENDIVEGRFKVADVEAAADILLPQTPEKLKELMSFTVFNPPRILPTCFLLDFIHEMYGQHLEERRELIRAIPRDRKISEIPRITQVLWTSLLSLQSTAYVDNMGRSGSDISPGVWSQIKRTAMGVLLQLCRHIGDNAKLVVIKNAGHAFNVERPREFYRHLKEFLIDHPPPGATCLSACENGK
ncbi:hypothetical protein Cgig2_026298 [Carnegiea gigantea]|uniref:AB hydrolase-1 domain-containing protein n=1 Tax=Carnegiea gigantea TaxID=171969 RepID=A0A9Q1KET7_9CARY|nr:hypothetical protein Cgig2_026298 [Carnegiea gigantea]